MRVVSHAVWKSCDPLPFSYDGDIFVDNSQFINQTEFARATILFGEQPGGGYPTLHELADTQKDV
jgi:hypothetical protein